MRFREADGVCKRKKDVKSYQLPKARLYSLKYRISDSSTRLVRVPMQGNRLSMKTTDPVAVPSTLSILYADGSHNISCDKK